MYTLYISRKVHVVELTPEERSTLESWSRSGKMEQRIPFLGKIILAASEGKESEAITSDLGTTVAMVGKWRRCFVENRLNRLADASRSGVTPTHTHSMFLMKEPLGRQDDYIEFRAEMDCLDAMSACPDSVVNFCKGGPPHENQPPKIQILGS